MSTRYKPIWVKKDIHSRTKSRAADAGLTMNDYLDEKTSDGLPNIPSLFRRKKKKGNLGIDAVYIAVVLLIVAVGLIAGRMVFSEIDLDIQSDNDIRNSTKDLVSQQNAAYPVLWDNLFVIMLVLVFVVVVLLNFLVDVHPAFIVIGILLMVLALVISPFLSNAYEDYTSDADVSTAVQGFPKMNWIMLQLPFVLLAMIMIMIGALYAKSKS